MSRQGKVELPTSSHVGKWRVGPMLASGGMGIVFLVRHEEIPTLRGVLKVMRPAALGTPADLEVRKDRFHREAEVLSKLHHRGCPQLLDFGHGADGMPYMVQEHVAGDTLTETLRRVGGLSGATACRIVEELADVLLAARRLGIAHRDVKPENIVLAESGAVLVDWGIALDDGAVRLTQPSFGLGTLAYIGPEEFTDPPAESGRNPDSAREVYALGVVLVECLTGRSAFPEVTSALVARKLQLPYLDAPEGCSAGVVEAIHAATRRDPAERVDLEGLRELVAREVVRVQTGSHPELARTPGPEPVLLSHPTLDASGPFPRPPAPAAPAPAAPTSPSPAAAASPPGPPSPAGIVSPAGFVSPAEFTPPVASPAGWRPRAVLAGIALLLPVLWLGFGAYRGRHPDAPTAENASELPATYVPAAIPPPSPAPPAAPVEELPAAAAPVPEVAKARPASASATDTCTGGVTLPAGKWRLRPRAPDSERLITASTHTPCGKYKLMEWNAETKDWDAKKNIVVRDHRVLTCSAKLHCSSTTR
ncbi:MAG: serine/threonine-protein kinase [Pseudomonadota bacterium]|nr:serine/threonine-protein kinase [Pseudomonadota bacterium]